MIGWGISFLCEVAGGQLQSGNIFSFLQSVKVKFGNNTGSTIPLMVRSLGVKQLQALWFKMDLRPSKSPGNLYLLQYERKQLKKNTHRKIDNMKTKLDIWRACGLSLLGKCLIEKYLGISQLIHVASMLTNPKTYIPTIKNAIFNFIWNNKQDKIKRDVMY